MTQSHRQRIRTVLIYVALIAACIAAMAPLVSMLSTSIKPEDQVLGDPMAMLPDPPSMTAAVATENYAAVLGDDRVDFPVLLRNTLHIALLSVLGVVLSSSVVAYGLARIRWRGRGAAFTIILATMMIPFPVIMVPLYMIFKELGWIGTFLPLWLPAWFGSAFSIFLLRQFFLTIPRELDDAARLDGCGHVGIFRHIILPLSAPALLVVGLLHFMFVWNDFLAPLIFLTHRDQFTLALGLQLYQSQQGATPWNLLMAASTMIVLPVLLLFILAQRSLVEGIATTGVKG